MMNLAILIVLVFHSHHDKYLLNYLLNAFLLVIKYFRNQIINEKILFMLLILIQPIIENIREINIEELFYYLYFLKVFIIF